MPVFYFCDPMDGSTPCCFSEATYEQRCTACDNSGVPRCIRHGALILDSRQFRSADAAKAYAKGLQET